MKNIFYYLVIFMIKATRKLLREYYVYWNNFKLICFSSGSDVVLGKRILMYGKIYIRVARNATLHIGNNFSFISGKAYNPLCKNIEGSICVNEGASLIIGSNVGMSSTSIWAHDSIIIGNYVKIGAGCTILDSDCHSLNYLDRRNGKADMENKRNKKIVIEDDVMIGAECIIFKGVHIGARSIIGGGSIVTKDIPSDCIAGGNPCKVLRYMKK